MSSFFRGVVDGIPLVLSPWALAATALVLLAASILATALVLLAASILAAAP